VLARLHGQEHQAEPVTPQLVVRSTTGPPPRSKRRTAQLTAGPVRIC
jgi:hypothetical protein